MENTNFIHVFVIDFEFKNILRDKIQLPMLDLKILPRMKEEITSILHKLIQRKEKNKNSEFVLEGNITCQQKEKRFCKLCHKLTCCNHIKLFKHKLFS